MSFTFKQAVIELGSWTIKAGLWEQTYLPTTLVKDPEGNVKERRYGEHFETEAVYPIIQGRLVDPVEFEHLMRHVLLKELQLAEPLNDVPVLLVVSHSWTRPVRWQILKIFLETIGVQGIYFGETPVMAAFGCATPNGLIIDVGHSMTEISVVWDGEVQAGAYEQVPLGGKDIDAALVQSLKDDSEWLQSTEELRSRYSVGRLTRLLKESTTLEPLEDKPDIFKFIGPEGVEIRCTKAVERIRSAYETLFLTDEASTGDTVPLAEAVNNVLMRFDSDRRPFLQMHLVLTGLSSRLPHLRTHLETYLRARLPVSDYGGDFQNKSIIHFCIVPEYYPDVWPRATPVAAWFGAGITAKCTLGDIRNLYTREELLQHGSRIFSHK